MSNSSARGSDGGRLLPRLGFAEGLVSPDRRRCLQSTPSSWVHGCRRYLRAQVGMPIRGTCAGLQGPAVPGSAGRIRSIIGTTFRNDVARLCCDPQLMPPPISGGQFSGKQPFLNQSIENFDKSGLVECDHLAQRDLVYARLSLNHMQGCVLDSCEAKLGSFLKENRNGNLVQPPDQMACARVEKIQNSFVCMLCQCCGPLLRGLSEARLGHEGPGSVQARSGAFHHFAQFRRVYSNNFGEFFRAVSQRPSRPIRPAFLDIRLARMPSQILH